VDLPAAGSGSVLQQVCNRLAADNKLRFRSLKLGKNLAWMWWAKDRYEAKITLQYARDRCRGTGTW
jgi:hypothetical protein